MQTPRLVFFGAYSTNFSCIVSVFREFNLGVGGRISADMGPIQLENTHFLVLKVPL